MKKRLLMLLGGSFLSAFLLVGCNLNDDQNPPPQDVNNNGANIKNVDPNPYDNDMLDNNRNDNRILDNDRNNGVLNRDRNNGVLDRDRNTGVLDRDRINNNRVNTTNDRNTRNDFDAVKDRNTTREDLIEDRNDALDRNNKDK